MKRDSYDATESSSDDRSKDAPGCWAGHLVALVQKEWIVDASIGQMHRPERGISMPDVFVGWAPRDFLKGRSGTVFASSDGARLTYRARLEDRSYERMPGFQPHGYNARLSLEVASVIARRVGKTA